MHVIVTEIHLLPGQADKFAEFYKSKAAPWYKANTKVERIELITDAAHNKVFAHRYYASEADAVYKKSGDAEYAALKAEAQGFATDIPVRHDAVLHSL
ncbi:MAG TPA: hypothetical protein VHX12_06395 [Acidisoma sp.]|jgi:hypothetical protein|nr:hypothetical protein [Acidisoma sp.]